MVTGAIGNPISPLLNQLAVSQSHLRSECPLYSTDGSLVSSEADHLAEEKFNEYLNQTNKDEIMDHFQSLGSALDMLMTSDTDMTPLQCQLVRWHRANLEYGCASDLEHVSLAHWDQDDMFAFSGPHSLLPDGYGSIAKKLAENIDIRHNHCVKKIDYEGDRVLVSCADGKVTSGDFAIVTVPLQILKKGSIQFNPPLPSWKLSAIRRLGAGLLNKVVLLFDEVFWTQEDYFGVLHEDPSSRGHHFMFWNLFRCTGQPILVALLAGPSAYVAEGEAQEVVVSTVMTTLTKIFPECPSHPVKSLVTAWGSDPFAGMTYSFISVNSTGADYDLIEKEVTPRLRFAGEATCRIYPATVPGAVRSGVVSASKIDLYCNSEHNLSRSGDWKDMKQSMEKVLLDTDPLGILNLGKNSKSESEYFDTGEIMCSQYDARNEVQGEDGSGSGLSLSTLGGGNIFSSLVPHSSLPDLPFQSMGIMGRHKYTGNATRSASYYVNKSGIRTTTNIGQTCSTSSQQYMIPSPSPSPLPAHPHPSLFEHQLLAPTLPSHPSFPINSSTLNSTSHQVPPHEQGQYSSLSITQNSLNHSSSSLLTTSTNPILLPYPVPPPLHDSHPPVGDPYHSSSSSSSSSSLHRRRTSTRHRVSKFEKRVSKSVVRYLSRFFKRGVVQSVEDFKVLARRITKMILGKEVKSFKKKKKHLSYSVTTEEKIKKFVNGVFRKLKPGEVYVVPYRTPKDSNKKRQHTSSNPALSKPSQDSFCPSISLSGPLSSPASSLSPTSPPDVSSSVVQDATADSSPLSLSSRASPVVSTSPSIGSFFSQSDSTSSSSCVPSSISTSVNSRISSLSPSSSSVSISPFQPPPTDSPVSHQRPSSPFPAPPVALPSDPTFVALPIPVSYPTSFPYPHPSVCSFSAQLQPHPVYLPSHPIQSSTLSQPSSLPSYSQYLPPYPYPPFLPTLPPAQPLPPTLHSVPIPFCTPLQPTPPNPQFQPPPPPPPSHLPSHPPPPPPSHQPSQPPSPSPQPSQPQPPPPHQLFTTPSNLVLEDVSTSTCSYDDPAQVVHQEGSNEEVVEEMMIDEVDISDILLNPASRPSSSSSSLLSSPLAPFFSSENPTLSTTSPILGLDCSLSTPPWLK